MTAPPSLSQGLDPALRPWLYKIYYNQCINLICENKPDKPMMIVLFTGFYGILYGISRVWLSVNKAGKLIKHTDEDWILRRAFEIAPVVPPVFIATVIFHSVTEQLCIWINTALFSLLSNVSLCILFARLVIRSASAVTLSSLFWFWRKSLTTAVKENKIQESAVSHRLARHFSMQ